MALDPYRQSAEKYRPKQIKVLFICESPPAYKPENGPSYFYIEELQGSDILFATIVHAIYNEVYKKDANSKGRLLRDLQDEGYFLIDVCKTPINRDENFRKRSDRAREPFIKTALPLLLDELKEMEDCGILGPETRIILIKKNIYKLLAKPLRDNGYQVLNRGKVDFPKYYRDRDTVREIRDLLGISF